LKEKVEGTKNNFKVFQVVGKDQTGRMEQRCIVLFLALKGISTTAIHHELVAVLQENAIS
jgi:hypothetical protein